MVGLITRETIPFYYINLRLYSNNEKFLHLLELWKRRLERAEAKKSGSRR